MNKKHVFKHLKNNQTTKPSFRYHQNIKTRVEFSAQKDVRVGLQWEDFLGKCSSKLLRFFGLHFPKKTSNCSPTLTSFDPPWQHNSYMILPPPPWQPNSYIILRTLNKLPPHSYIVLLPQNKLPPHSYIILPPLAAQLLHHFTPSEQITPSLLHHFIPLGSPTITSFYPL